MNHLKSFDKYNEGWNFFGLFGGGSRPWDSEIKKLKITQKKLNKQHLQFSHNGKLVAEVQLYEEEITEDTPVWILTIYIYESETKKRSGVDETSSIPGQREQPFGETTETFVDAEEAVNAFIKWWKTYTKSGRNQNRLFSI